MQFTTDWTDNDVSMYKAKDRIHAFSGHFSQGQLEVHLEEMLWVYNIFVELT